MQDAPQYNPPAAPDPQMMAAAQGKQERMAARANNLYMNPQVNSPFGRIKYNKNEEMIDGEKVERPLQEIELNPLEQEAYEKGHEARRNLGQIAAPLGQQLMQGVQGLGDMEYIRPDFGNVERAPRMGENNEERRRFEDAYYNRGMELMAPQMERDEERLRARLAAMGHPVGNEAYKNEMDQFQRGRDANFRQLGYDAMMHGGQEQRNMYGLGREMRGEQLGEAMRPYDIAQMERRNRMGENQFNMAALQGIMGGFNPQLPQLQQFNAPAMRAPDIGGMYQQNYQHQLGNYNQAFGQDMANYRANLGGMYGLAGQGLGMAGRYMMGGY